MFGFYFVPYIFSYHLPSVQVSSHDRSKLDNVYMNYFDNKDLGNHVLQLRPQLMKHPVYISLIESRDRNA